MSGNRRPDEARSGTTAGLLVDRFGRSKKKLRLSLTDRCNYRCLYCMPEAPAWKPKADLLCFEELMRLAELFVAFLGIDQIRLTGGEPLLRQRASDFIAMLHELRGIGLRRISMTTNGVLLAGYVQALAKAGLDDVNVSLDSLSPPRFATLTGGGDVAEVLCGIEEARAAGLPVKVNAVVIRGHNEGDVLPLCEWAYAGRLPLRFIEFMPLDGRGLWSPDKVVTEREIVALLASRFEVALMPRTREPATYYLLDGTYPLGIVSSVSNPFCAGCDRVRLTAAGELFPCLFSPAGVDLRTPLRAGVDRDELERMIRRAIFDKERGAIERSGNHGREVKMHVLGG